jgi:hypothetical protein
MAKSTSRCAFDERHYNSFMWYCSSSSDSQNYLDILVHKGNPVFSKEAGTIAAEFASSSTMVVE